jgi:hypothetical protein
MNSSKLASAINIFSGAEKSDSSKFKIEVLNKDLPDGICPAGAPLLAGLALLAALTLTGGNAWAAGSGVLDLSAWSYALTDLAPQDGIAPGIVISDLSNGLTYRSNIVYQSMSEQTWNSLPLSWTGGLYDCRTEFHACRWLYERHNDAKRSRHPRLYAIRRPRIQGGAGDRHNFAERRRHRLAKPIAPGARACKLCNAAGWIGLVNQACKRTPRRLVASAMCQWN